MKSANPTTKMGGYVSSPSLSVNALIQIHAYSALLLRTTMICLIAEMRIQWAYDTANPSVFEANSVFKIIGVASKYTLAVVIGIFLCLEWGLHRYTSEICYTVLNFVGSFAAFLAPFSLLMVLLLPPELNWIAYMVVCGMFGIFATCFYLDDHQVVKRSSGFDCLVIGVIHLLFLLALCLPEKLNYIACGIIYVALGMDGAYHLLTYLLFINEKAREPHNLEAQLPIKQDKNTRHLGINYLQVLGRN